MVSWSGCCDPARFAEKAMVLTKLDDDTAATIALLFKLTPPDGWIARPVREALENN